VWQEVLNDGVALQFLTHQLFTTFSDRDGSSRCGVYCAIANLVERLKNENRVDVFRAVKDLRDWRPGMVGNMEQYKFCYEAVGDYIQSFDLYGNFK